MKRLLALLLVALALFAVACTPAVPPAGSEPPTEEGPPAGNVTPPEEGGEEPPAPTRSLSLSAAPCSAVGERLSVKATGVGCDLSGIEFFLSDESLCSVFSASGDSCMMRFKKEGELTVKATCEGLEATCTVRVFPEESEYAPSEPLITYLGRTAEEKGTRVLRNTASGFEITFFGKRLIADWEVVSGECAISVFLDGEEDPEADKRIVKADGKLVLAEFDTAGTHTVRVQKVSEESISVLALRSLTVEKGGLLEAEPVERVKIEVYGDSITCGYGNMRESAINDGLFATTQNGLNTYAAIAARRLDADYRVFARSGIGLYTNGNYIAKDIDEVYGRVSPMSGEDALWDMKNDPPDIVIINLGTNDAGATAANADRLTGGNPFYSAEGFSRAAVAFAKDLQAAYGKEDIVFVFCSGMMTAALDAPTASAVATLKSEGINAHALVLPARTGYGGHPMYDVHVAAAEVLYDKLVELIFS